MIFFRIVNIIGAIALFGMMFSYSFEYDLAYKIFGTVEAVALTLMLYNSILEGRRMSDKQITETSMHHLICAMCDNEKCVRGTKECEFEKWKKKEESEGRYEGT